MGPQGEQKLFIFFVIVCILLPQWKVPPLEDLIFVAPEVFSYTSKFQQELYLQRTILKIKIRLESLKFEPQTNL